MSMRRQLLPNQRFALFMVGLGIPIGLHLALKAQFVTIIAHYSGLTCHASFLPRLLSGCCICVCATAARHSVSLSLATHRSFARRLQCGSQISLDKRAGVKNEYF
jgi:hypothetical protein